MYKEKIKELLLSTGRKGMDKLIEHMENEGFFTAPCSTRFGVYDTVLPPKDTPYPFIYLADCSESDQATKNEIIGETNLTLKVWHDNIRQRGTVSGILADIKNICRSIEHTAHYAWSMQRPTQKIMPDNTTKQPLLMGILEVGYKFS